MKANKTYSSGGVEYFMCPFTKMFITQGSNTWSHSGVMAVDVTNGDGSKAPLYAPATSQCVAVYQQAGQSVWKTVNPVYIANGKKTVVWYCIAHDNSLNAQVGMRIKQGQQIANMGDKGVGTGVHCHFEVGASNDNAWGFQKGGFNFNGVNYPVYGFKNEPYDFEDVCYMDDTIILSGNAKWKYIGKKGWKYENNQWYYYKNNTLLKGWQQIDNEWYYFEDEGYIKYGWIKYKDKWYYLNEKGQMLTGNARINGKDYVFNSKGEMK